MPDSNEILNGTVKWFDKDKGFGFIKMPEDQLDVFVHASELRRSGIVRSLHTGERVVFTPARGPKGIIATQVLLPDEQQAVLVHP